MAACPSSPTFMTLVLLTAVSLCTLVVASPVFVNPSTALQAAFHTHPGEDVDPARFSQQIEHVSLQNIAAIASFEISPVVETVDEQRVFDGGPAASGPVVDEQRALDPLVVLAFSCLAAFLTLACTALTLYIIKSLRSQMLASKAAWDLLPRFWRRSSSQQETSAQDKNHVLGPGRLLLQPDCLHAEEGSAERHGLHMQDKPLCVDAVSDMESEWDDVDEKYQDALDTTPLALVHDLPREESVPHSTHFDDPPSLPCPLDQPTAEATDRSTCLMHEFYAPPVSRPAWSVRAIDSPALGLSMREGDGVASTPQPLVHPRRRAYRAVPEFDVALAMQLRPGLGIGADSAWMVRFLMTIFGWFAVALTGNAR